MTAAKAMHLRTTQAGERMFALTILLRSKRQESSVSTHGLTAVYSELSLVEVVEHLRLAVPLSACFGLTSPVHSESVSPSRCVIKF